LNDMLLGQGAGTGTPLDNASSQISPGGGVSMSSSGGAVAALSALPTAASGVATPVIGTGALAARPAPAPGVGQDGLPGGAAATGTKSTSSGGVLMNVRITSDVTNNAVLVYANAESQRVVEQTIRQIDRPQRQIAIEATIAEVTLNDRLNYGVQFSLASQKGSLVNTVATQPGANSTFEQPSNAVNAAANALLSRALPGF